MSGSSGGSTPAALSAKAHGITPPDSVGSYERGVIRNGVGCLSGQFPIRDGRLTHVGRVGAELTEAQGAEAAEIAALNIIAQLNRLLGGLTWLEGLLRLDGYVASADGFLRQPAVLDAASSLLIRELGDRGRHARSAVSVPRLPLDAPVELVVTFAVVENARIGPDYKRTLAEPPSSGEG